jgi:putative membrane protein
MAEVKLGRLAEEKGTNRAVKSFGRRMVDDNIKNARQMRTIVPQQSLTTVSGLDKADQNIYDQLSKLSGHDFDRAYARDTVRADAEILTEYLRESMVGENAAVKTYAVRSLPKLDKHLVMARKMQKAVNRKAHDSENRPASAAKGRNYSEPAT